MTPSNASILPSTGMPVQPFTLDFITNLEADIAAGKRVTVKNIAIVRRMTSAKVRAGLVAYYGRSDATMRISFHKGRTGGIHLHRVSRIESEVLR